MLIRNRLMILNLFAVHYKSRSMRVSLIFLVSLVAISAFPSGILLMYQPNGSLLGLSVSMLESSSFQNFFIPGLILMGLVGGSSLASLFLLLMGKANAYKFSMAAGVILFFWIITQMTMVHYYQWLQGCYLVIALFISLLSYQLMGKTVL